MKAGRQALSVSAFPIRRDCIDTNTPTSFSYPYNRKPQPAYPCRGEMQRSDGLHPEHRSPADLPAIGKFRCMCDQRGYRNQSAPVALNEQNQLTGDCDMDLIRIILSIILPPLGVFMQVGLGKHFWLNILLTILGYIPGIVHAVWIIARR